MFIFRLLVAAFCFCILIAPTPTTLPASMFNVQAEPERNEAVNLLAVKNGNNSLFVIGIAAVSIVGGLCIVGLIIWLVIQHEKKRTAGLAAVADELGLQFSAGQDGALLVQMQTFALFNKGRSRKMTNVMTAETELTKLAIFDYRYTTGSGKHSHTHSHTFVSMETASLQLPQFSVQPEGFFDRIGAKLGFQDIDFEEHPEFSDAFILKGNNEAAIRSFFDAEMLDLFASNRGVLVDAYGSLMLYRKGSGRKKPEQIPEFMAEAYEFLNGFQKRDA